MADDVTILGSRSRRWPDQDEGPWVLRLTFGIVSDRPAVVGVELYAIDPEQIAQVVPGWPELAHGSASTEFPAVPEPISSTGVRVPLGELLAEFLAGAKRSAWIAANAKHAPSWTSLEEWRQSGARTLKKIEDATAKRGPGRPAVYDRAHFEQVAGIYAEALRYGEAPTEAVAFEMHVSKSTAAKWVAKARSQKLGLLPETVRGKAAAWPATKKRRR